MLRFLIVGVLLGGTSAHGQAPAADGAGGAVEAGVREGDVESDAEGDADAGSDAGAGSGARSDAESDAETDAETVAETETETDAETVAEPETEPETETDAETDAAETESSVRDGANAETGAATEDESVPGDENAEPGTEIVDDEDTRWLIGLGGLIGQSRTDVFDAALAARGYGAPSPTYGIDLGVLYRATSWLSVGLRTALRHRYWLHYELPATTLLGVDLLLAIDGRYSLGRVAQIGLHAAFGLGIASIAINDAREASTDVRVQVGPLATFRLKGTLRALVRFAYDHFQPRLAGSSADLGGFTFLVGLEVRE